jgi:UPF0176 protein
MVMKPFRTLLYYKYVHIPDAAVYTQQHIELCQRLGLVGRIIIAPEGLNGTVSGTVVQCQKYMDALSVHPLFAGIDFKIDDVDEPSFAALHVRHKDEIVNSGTHDMPIDPSIKTGIHLEPAAFAAMMADPEVVVLDVRSRYESGLGRFKGAVIAEIDNFREFPDYIANLEVYKDKKVMTYCTGGIKCEKASALLLEAGFKDVYQLHGGIIKYGKEMQGRDFEGDCYVFDKRVSVSVNAVNHTVISSCHICGTASTHMINCANASCNDHLVLCESCGWQTDGCCSEACQQSDTKRVYDGTGYYGKD